MFKQLLAIVIVVNSLHFLNSAYCTSSPSDRMTSVSSIPRVGLASEVVVDGRVDEEAWEYAYYLQGFSHNKKTIEFEALFMHDCQSIYMAVAIYDNDFCGEDPIPDAFSLELNDRDDGNYGGETGNDLKRVRVRSVGLGDYEDKYIPLDEVFDTTINGEGAFTYSNFRIRNGEIGDYLFELRVPLNGSHPEDAELSGGVPFGMVGAFTDYDSADGVGYRYILFEGSFILQGCSLPTFEVTVDFYPYLLNLMSVDREQHLECYKPTPAQCNWITAVIEVIEPQEHFNVENIDIPSIIMNQTIRVDPVAPVDINDFDEDGIPDLAVRFNRTEVIDFLIAEDFQCGNVTLTLEGEFRKIASFQADGVIRVSNLVGDVDCDGVVDLLDLTTAVVAYSSTVCEERWNANANFAPLWNMIDIFDFVTLIYHLGETCQ